MFRRSTYLFGLLSLFVLLTALSTSAWPDSKIYVQEVDTAPKIDGKTDPTEWKTDEELFKETIKGLTFTLGAQTEIALNLIVLRDTSNLYVLVTIISEISDASTNMSIGLAFSNENMDGQVMQIPGSVIFDRKVVFYNGSTYKYDLHACSGSACNSTRDLTPGVFDSEAEFTVTYGKNSDNKPFFEFKLPFAGNPSEDVTIGEGTHMKILVNPYANIVDGLIGHGGKGTKDLEFTYSKRGFFQRPEGPMSTMSIVFNGLFGLMVTAVSILFILAGRSENIAKKLWNMEITEEMAKKSILMEFGYYNSSFLGMFSLFFFIVYSLVSLIYGFWAHWGNIGIVIGGVPSLLSIIAFVDLGQRNKNPQEIPDDEQPPKRTSVEKSGALWIIPPVFLGLVLFMLVFIGIDVIT